MFARIKLVLVSVLGLSLAMVTIPNAQAFQLTCDSSSAPRLRGDQYLLVNTVRTFNFDKSDFFVTGCRFRPGESIVVVPEFTLGEQLIPLETREVVADELGHFELRFTYDGEPSDFIFGYEFAATATGDSGDVATSHLPGIREGPMPPSGPPETGAGGIASEGRFDRTPLLLAVGALAMAAYLHRIVAARQGRT